MKSIFNCRQGEWCVLSDFFRDFINYFAQNNYKTITLDELVTIYKTKVKLPEKRIVLTFDDGRKGIIKHVMPLLEKYHFNGVVYLVSNWIGNNQMKNNEHYSDFLTDNDIKVLIDKGMQMGYHSSDHKCFNTKSCCEIIKDITLKKKDLENKIGVRLYHFSYPYGHFNKTVHQLVKENGNFISIATSDRHMRRDRFLLPRISIKNKMSINYFSRLLHKDSWIALNKIKCYHNSMMMVESSLE